MVSNYKTTVLLRFLGCKKSAINDFVNVRYMSGGSGSYDRYFQFALSLSLIVFEIAASIWVPSCHSLKDVTDTNFGRRDEAVLHANL